MGYVLGLAGDRGVCGKEPDARGGEAGSRAIRTRAEKADYAAHQPGNRIKESAMWAAWAPKLKEAIKASLQRVNRETLEEVRVKAARGPTRDEQWRMHVENEHVPHRRDCRVCMEAAGRAAFVMLVDILGPTREGGGATSGT